MPLSAQANSTCQERQRKIPEPKLSYTVFVEMGFILRNYASDWIVISPHIQISGTRLSKTKQAN